MTGTTALEPVARFARDLARLLSHISSPAQAGAQLRSLPDWAPACAGEQEMKERLALAVSGGPDSLALLLLAQAAQPGRVIAATVDHGLRPTAADEAHAVAALCAQLGVPHTTLPVEVTPAGTGLQAAARAARYAALAAWATAEGAAFLATAHHRDDQAETLLLRLTRGAGLDGLAGIRPARPLAPGLTLVRPLLGWSKAELGAIVAEAGLTPADDPSNRDPRFDRTRARAMMEGGWPAPARLAASAAHLAEAQDALAWAAAQLAEERIRADGAALAIDVAGVPRELRRRLLLAAIARLVPDAAPRGDEIARLIARLEAGRVSTLAGVRLAPGPPWRLALAPPRRSL